MVVVVVDGDEDEEEEEEDVDDREGTDVSVAYLRMVMSAAVTRKTPEAVDL